MERRGWLLLLITLKGLVIGLTAIGAFGDLERFEEKGFGWRLLEYPIAVLALPVLWRAFGRGRPYPYVADLLLTLPFLIDVLGNVVDLYDTVSWWDDANHFANWLFLSLGLGVLLLRASLEPVVTAALVLGFGGVLAVVWELGEYVTFIRTNEEELETAYRDTIADLTFDLVGASIAAGITWWLARRRAAGAQATRRAPT
jgi:hypothetical protein